MKTYYFLPLLAALSFTACSGVVDPDEQQGDTAAPYTLTVDKAQIESDGADMAVFTITDANGTVLTDAAHIRNTSFEIVETGEVRSGMGSDEDPNTFSSITDGTYTFKAMYLGTYCENEVKVISRNRAKYEKFHKNVLVYRFTATWCRYCPYMTEALDNVNDYTKDHSLVVQFHGKDEFTLYEVADVSDYATGIYNTDGFPYCIYSLVSGSAKRTVSDIQKNVKDVLYAYPAQTGIKVSSSLTGDELTVTAEVSASVDGTYDLALAIVKDGCVPVQDTEAYEKEYDNVLRGITANYRAMSTEAFSLSAGGSREMALTVPAEGLSEAADDCRIVLFTLRKAGGKVIVDNAVELGVGDAVDYRYN